MTYFYAQLFAMETEIRAMFPAAMDVQRRRPGRLIRYDMTLEGPKASQSL